MDIAIIIGIIVGVILIIFLIVQNIKQSDKIKKLTQREKNLRKEVANCKEAISALENKNNILNKENTNLTAQVRELLDKNSKLEYQTFRLHSQSHTLKNLAQNVQDAISSLYHNVTAAISSLYHKSSDITDIMGMLSFNSATATENKSYTSVKEEIETIEKYVRVLHDTKTSKTNYVIDTENVQKESPYYEHDSILELISFPLVENAFQHGNVKADDFLSIRYALFNNVFTVEVKNKLNEDYERRKKYSGLGIENLKQRLDLFYPNCYKLERKAENGFYWCYLQIIIKQA
ncbi:MAG: hypothetical protein J6Y35_02780 [Bacteroidales bacterium]|nr:hypothetical protein [Bacteroidales bacterium]